MLIIAFLIGVSVLVPVYGVARYLHWFSNYQLPHVDDARLPRAAILLAVRGAAPSLDNCLSRLASQAYPRYEIHVIVDHPTDPACEVIQRWGAKHPDAKLNLSFLENPSSKAYLKTSAILQCMRTLRNDIGAVVLADADTLAYPTWLRDLVQPLAKESIGLVSGNRWYDPTSRTLGELIRFFYNALCVPPMYFMGATWSGSLAIDRAVFDNDAFRERMSDTSSEDKAILATACEVGLELEMQPDVMLLNRESCTLGEAFRFVKRQLLWTRLYHPSWPLLLVGTWTVHLFFSALLFVGIYALTIGKSGMACICLGGILLEIFTCQCLTEWLHRSVSRRAKQVQGIDYPKINWPARCRMIVVLPVAFAAYSNALLSAALARRVDWSGITYKVLPPDSIRMVEYFPTLKGPGTKSE